MHKEYLSYGKEATKQTAKIAKMREEGKDAYDIRKQVRCVASPLRCIAALCAHHMTCTRVVRALDSWRSSLRRRP